MARKTFQEKYENFESTKPFGGFSITSITNEAITIKKIDTNELIFFI